FIHARACKLKCEKILTRPKRLICSEDSRKDTSRLETQKHRELQLTVFLGITTFFDCAVLKSSKFSWK
ncbi:hypothetical protein, partial [Ruthenibacterium lactatiformans]|uniref:hypothetical protein n=1 Tax=Ruthenibacterium lactatiformans TaxID=1550024 RepID=UPI0026726082